MAAQKAKEFNDGAWVGPSTVPNDQIAERVVGSDRFIRHVEQIEETCDDDASSVAPCSAAHEKRSGARLGDPEDCGRKRVEAIVQHLEVADSGSLRALIDGRNPVVPGDLKERK